MDPELLNLFNKAIARQGSRSKVISALQDPYVAFLAGQYDPYAAQGGASVSGAGGSLWGTYANNPDYPEIQPIIQAIQNGADEYQTREAVNRILAGNSSTGFFSGDNLMNLAVDLQKEYSGGGSTSGSGGSSSKSSKDTWGKAGIRNPSEVYGLSDVPLDAKASATLASLVPGYEDITKKAMLARQLAQADVNAFKKTKGKIEKKYSPDEKYNPVAVHDASGFVYMPKFISDDKPYSAMMDTRKQNNDKAFQSSAEAAALQMEQDKQAAVATAVRQGVLKAYQEMGRTPAKDQMTGILKFLAQSGK